MPGSDAVLLSPGASGVRADKTWAVSKWRVANVGFTPKITVVWAGFGTREGWTQRERSWRHLMTRTSGRLFELIKQLVLL